MYAGDHSLDLERLMQFGWIGFIGSLSIKNTYCSRGVKKVVWYGPLHFVWIR